MTWEILEMIDERVRKILIDLTRNNGELIMDGEYWECVDCGAGPDKPVIHSEDCIVTRAEAVLSEQTD